MSAPLTWGPASRVRASVAQLVGAPERPQGGGQVEDRAPGDGFQGEGPPQEGQGQLRLVAGQEEVGRVRLHVPVVRAGLGGDAEEARGLVLPAVELGGEGLHPGAFLRRKALGMLECRRHPVLQRRERDARPEAGLRQPEVGEREARIDGDGLLELGQAQLARPGGTIQAAHALEVVAIGLQASGDGGGRAGVEVPEVGPGPARQPLDEREDGLLARGLLVRSEEVLVPPGVERAHLDHVGVVELAHRGEQERTSGCLPADHARQRLVHPLGARLSLLARQVPHAAAGEDAQDAGLLERVAEQAGEAVQVRIAGLVGEVGHGDGDPAVRVHGELPPPEMPGGEPGHHDAQDRRTRRRAGPRGGAGRPLERVLGGLEHLQPGGSVPGASGRIGGRGGRDRAGQLRGVRSPSISPSTIPAA